MADGDKPVDSDGNGLPDALEEAWAAVLELVSKFLKNHDQFGFELIAKKSNPTLEDMLLSLKTMGAILNILASSPSLQWDSQRMVLNAKQQIVWFEQATLALQAKDQGEYEKFVEMMKNQAHV